MKKNKQKEFEDLVRQINNMLVWGSHDDAIKLLDKVTK